MAKNIIDFITAFLVLVWLGWHGFKKIKINLPPLATPILIFLAIALASLFFNAFRLATEELLIAGLYWLRLAFYFGFYFLLFDLQKYFSWLNRKLLNQALLTIGLTTAIIGFIQYFFWPDLRFLAILHWDPHYYRLTAPFLDPGYTGLILVLTLILLVSSKASYFLMALTYFALALTYSRSSYLAFLVGMGTIAWLKKSPKIFLTAFFVLLLTLFILPRQSGGEGVTLERKSTIQARIENWKQTLTIIKGHSLFGVGFNAYRYAQRDYGFLTNDWQVNHAGAGADSSLLFVLATTGIIGFISYSWFWVKVFQLKSVAILATTAALLVHSLFLNSLFYPWVLIWLGIVLSF